MEVPSALSVMQVRMEGVSPESHPLPLAVIHHLRTRTGVRVQESGDAPRLILFGERTERRLLSVTATGKADAYLLIYEVSFRVVGADNNPLSPPQTVRVQRDHQFDRFSVLAKESEEQDLWREMQRDAAQQIVRRLSRAVINQNADERGLINR